MKTFIAAAFAVFLAVPAFAISGVRYDPMNFEVEETKTHGQYITHTIVDGPCTNSPPELRAHMRATGMVEAPPVMVPGRGLVLALVATSDDYAEGWWVRGDQACLLFITERMPV
jgi:hypothetical protein